LLADERRKKPQEPLRRLRLRNKVRTVHGVQRFLLRKNSRVALGNGVKRACIRLIGSAHSTADYVIILYDHRAAFERDCLTMALPRVACLYV